VRDEREREREKDILFNSKELLQECVSFINSKNFSLSVKPCIAFTLFSYQQGIHHF